MAKDDFTRLQNYIKRLASSAEEARELISKLVLIDWNAIYPTKQNAVVTTGTIGEIDPGQLIAVRADTPPEEVNQSTEQFSSDDILVGNVILGSTRVVADTQILSSQSVIRPAMKPRRSKKPSQPKPKYWEIKQQQLETREARLAKSARVKELQAMPYAEYLKTDEWRKKRNQSLASSGMKCQMCSIRASDMLLNVHHNTYERLGYERPSDLIVLCDFCHARHHDKLPKPKQNS